jgi:hypothetical protein
LAGERVGQSHDPQLEPAVKGVVDEESVQDRVGEATHRPFLDHDEDLALARKPEDEIDVERPSEARVGDSRREPARFESSRPSSAPRPNLHCFVKA